MAIGTIAAMAKMHGLGGKRRAKSYIRKGKLVSTRKLRTTNKGRRKGT